MEGAFRIFDKDGSGSVSLEEFLETMHQFAQQGDEEKLSFLFKVYDPNGDGVIDQSELREIIKSCVAENGMEFDETQVMAVLVDDCQSDYLTGRLMTSPELCTRMP